MKSENRSQPFYFETVTLDYGTDPSFFTILLPGSKKHSALSLLQRRKILTWKNRKIDEGFHRTFEEWLIGRRFRNLCVQNQKHTEPVMWLEDEETIQTWVNGGEVILKKVGRDYTFRLANEPGDWIEGLPDGMVWADAQSLFGDSLQS